MCIRDRLRSSAPIRTLDVSFASPVPPGWADGLPGASRALLGAAAAATGDGGPSERHRLAVDASADPGRALQAAEATGVAVRRFAFEPPDLSEVFRQAVGRSVAEIEAQADGPDGSGAPDGSDALDRPVAAVGGDPDDHVDPDVQVDPADPDRPALTRRGGRDHG